MSILPSQNHSQGGSNSYWMNEHEHVLDDPGGAAEHQCARESRGDGDWHEVADLVKQPPLSPSYFEAICVNDEVIV